jgi:hypothetical protein
MMLPQINNYPMKNLPCKKESIIFLLFNITAFANPNFF